METKLSFGNMTLDLLRMGNMLHLLPSVVQNVVNSSDQEAWLQSYVKLLPSVVQNMVNKSDH